MTSNIRRMLLWGISITFLIPFIYLLLLSLSGSWAFPAIWPKEITLRNWEAIFSYQTGIQSSFLFSVIISLSVACIATSTAFITSKFIAYHPKRGTWMLLSYFPFILSPVIYAACIYFFFIRTNLTGNTPGVVLGQLLIAYPYAVIIFSGFWNKQLKSMEELTTTLGGNTLQIYMKVLIPAAKGMLLVVFFQTFLISWFEYGLTTIIGVGKVQTLTLKVFQYINEANIFYAALSSCLLIIPPAILLYINKKFVFKEHAG